MNVVNAREFDKSNDTLFFSKRHQYVGSEYISI
jgi:hypothetical protein